MERKIGSAILKGSMLLAAMFLMEGSVYPVQAEEYSTFGTFSPDHFPAAAKEGETIEEESEVLSLGEKISRFGTGNGLSGSPGKIPSRADEFAPLLEVQNNSSPYRNAQKRQSHKKL